jgi:hypothetical protein
MEEPFYWARPALNIKECKKLHNSSPSLAKLDWHLPFQLSLPRILCSPWEVSFPQPDRNKPKAVCGSAPVGRARRSEIILSARIMRSEFGASRQVDFGEDSLAAATLRTHFPLCFTIPSFRTLLRRDDPKVGCSGCHRQECRLRKTP